MSKRRLESLQAVQKIAEKEVTQAFQALTQFRMQLARHQQMLHDLKGYLSHYHAQLGTQLNRGMPAHNIQFYQTFLDNIQQNIESEVGQIQQLEKHEAKALAYWQQKQSRIKALEKLIANFHYAQMQKDEKQAQAETDDWVLARLDKSSF